MAKTKAPKKAPKPPAETTDCDYCLYLKRFYPDVPLASLKLHCGKHRLEKLPDTDGLPPAATDKVAPEPQETAPPQLVALWDGRVRTCWAAAGTVPPPQSVAWEHLKEWADARRADNPRLTVRALVILYRGCRPQEVEEGVCRIKKLFPEESRAEAMIWKQEFTDKPEQSALTNSSVASKSEPSSPKKSRPESTGGPIQKESGVSSGSTNRTGSKETDEWGYKTGTRAATINAFLSDKWMTSKEIESKSGATSAGSHLSALVAAGHAEYQKPAPGEKGGKFRRKP